MKRTTLITHEFAPCEIAFVQSGTKPKTIRTGARLYSPRPYVTKCHTAPVEKEREAKREREKDVRVHERSRAEQQHEVAAAAAAERDAAVLHKALAARAVCVAPRTLLCARARDNSQEEKVERKRGRVRERVREEAGGSGKDIRESCEPSAPRRAHPKTE
ncbi:unnamed protein product [Trichogramma brassicae]|uniref:Uncharacterized protein n=1 Tax=Trichogramma brassicae TaxID=86971 RepID=A0A6H5ISV9_9HYME|nr:unnamed protein product [Trichogramma brassicae]